MCDVMTTAGALGLAGQGLGGLARLSDAKKAEKRAKRAAAGEEAARDLIGRGQSRADAIRDRAQAERRRARTTLLGSAPTRLLGGFPVTGTWPGAGRGR